MTDDQYDDDDTAPDEDTERVAKEGGHGTHWGTLFPDLDNEPQLLLNLLQVVAEQPDRSEPFDTPAGPGLALYGGAGPLQTCVLLDAQNRLVSAFPAVQDGHRWTIAVDELIPWANGVEGQVTGFCQGALVQFFDTRWWANHHRYEVGQSYDFVVNGLCYVLRPATIQQFDLANGQPASTQGMRAYMPARLKADSDDVDIDDYWFQSPLEARRDDPFGDPPLVVYTCALALPDDVPLTVDLYAAPHTQSAALIDLPLGADLSGFVWLQGYLAE